MKISKKIARKILFPAAMLAGIDKVIRRQSSNSILNIMYHGVVLNNSTYFSPRHIYKTMFEKQLAYYKENFDVISIPEAFHYKKNNIIPKKKSITISFDDGFQNNFQTALPLLEKYNVKTTFFVSSVCTSREYPNYLWSELIAALNYFYKKQVIYLGDIKFENLVNIEMNISLTNFLKSRSYKAREQYIIELDNKYKLISKLETLPSEIWRLMNKDELIKLSDSKVVEIGSHGHLHHNLGNIDLVDAKKELLLSKKLLEETIDKEVNMIAYPDGSYNSEVKSISQDLGFVYQMAVNYLKEEDAHDMRIMNRHGISSTTTFESNMIFLNAAFKTKGL